jgi:hypothetical protein
LGRFLCGDPLWLHNSGWRRDLSALLHVSWSGLGLHLWALCSVNVIIIISVVCVIVVSVVVIVVLVYVVVVVVVLSNVWVVVAVVLLVLEWSLLLCDLLPGLVLCLL